MQRLNLGGFIFIIGFCTFLFFISCNHSRPENQKQIDSTIVKKGVPEITFDTLFYDFGNLIDGEKVSCIFTFKNTGTADLIIYDAFSTCGCTVPNFSKEPLKPGGDGKIEVVFDSSGRKGVQYKNITLKLNTIIKEKTLTIKANVNPNNF